jgi:hypothetical protein
MTIYSGFSHWKWWFSMAMLVYQRVNHPAMDPRWKPPGSPAPSPCWEGARNPFGFFEEAMAPWPQPEDWPSCPVKQVSGLKHQPTHIHYMYTAYIYIYIYTYIHIYISYIHIYIYTYIHIYIYNYMLHTHTHTHQAFKVHMWFTRARLSPAFNLSNAVLTIPNTYAPKGSG